MGELLVWFYCLPLEGAAALLALGAGILWLLEKKWGQTRLFRSGVRLCFALWLGAILYTTLLSREPGSSSLISVDPFSPLLQWLSGKNREAMRSALMNTALFFPGGVLLGAWLPRHWPVGRRAAVGAILLGLLSLGIECTQYVFFLGRAETGDVLFNTLGALLGLLSGGGKERK